MYQYRPVSPLRSVNAGVFLFFLLFLVLSFSDSEAQTSAENDTLKQKSVSKTDTTAVTPVHSVRKATLLSTFLPGAGQVYNRKAWKIPIIYAALGGLVYLAKINDDRYNEYEDALVSRYDDDPLTIDPYLDVYTDDNLRSLSDYYRRNRDLSIGGAILVYAMNIIDAHVDAHLYSFDVSDDLSINWHPEIKPVDGMFSPGIYLSLNF